MTDEVLALGASCPGDGSLVVEVERTDGLDLSQSASVRLEGPVSATRTTAGIPARATFDRLSAGEYRLELELAGDEEAFVVVDPSRLAISLDVRDQTAVRLDIEDEDPWEVVHACAIHDDDPLEPLEMGLDDEAEDEDEWEITSAAVFEE